MPVGEGVEHRRLVDATWLAVLPLILNAASVLANGYIIRSLGETGYGSLVVALGLTGVTTIVSNLGMRALYTKAVAGATDASVETLIEEQLGLRLRLAGLAGAISITAAWLLYPHDRIVLACTALQAVGLIVTVAWTVLADVLNAREMFRTNALIAFWAGSVLTVLSVAAAAVGGGPVLVAAAYLIGPAVNLGLQFRAVAQLKVRIRIRRAAHGRYRALLRESRALAMNDLLNVLNSRAEGVWAPLIFGKELMGVYAAGTLPQSRLGMASDGVATAYFSMMAKAHSIGDDESLHRGAAGMFTLLLATSIPLAVFTLVGAPYLGHILFPADTQRGSAVLASFVTQVSAFAIPLAAISLGLRYALQAAAQHSQNAKDQMASTILSVVVVLGLTLLLGVRGLALGLVFRSAINIAFQCPTFHNHFPHLLPSIPISRLLGISAALVCYSTLTVGFRGALSLVEAICWSAVGAITYSIVAYRIGLISRPKKESA